MTGARLPLVVRAVLATVVPLTVAGVVPWWMLDGRVSPPAPWRWLFTIPMLGGVLFSAWSVVLFGVRGRGTLAPIDPPTTFVAQGPYRYTRNPMYVGVTCWLLSLAGFTASRTVLWYALLLPLGFHSFVVLVEEPGLRRRFGAAYCDYCRRVPRWLGVRHDA